MSRIAEQSAQLTAPTSNNPGTNRPPERLSEARNDGEYINLWREKVLAAPLSDTEKAVAFGLAQLFNTQQWNTWHRCAWPSAKTLGAMLGGKTQRAVQKTLARLRKAGWITSVGVHRYGQNIYAFTDPTEPDTQHPEDDHSGNLQSSTPSRQDGGRVPAGRQERPLTGGKVENEVENQVERGHEGATHLSGTKTSSADTAISSPPNSDVDAEFLTRARKQLYPEHCAKHAGVAVPPNCNKCKTQRLAYADAERRERDAKTQRDRERARNAAGCAVCNGSKYHLAINPRTGIEYEVVCNHTQHDQRQHDEALAAKGRNDDVASTQQPQSQSRGLPEWCRDVLGKMFSI